MSSLYTQGISTPSRKPARGRAPCGPGRWPYWTPVAPKGINRWRS
jgi:hypothetical protein